MRLVAKSVCYAITLALFGAMPARAEPLHEAAQLRKLDIMLMVTSLGCRRGKNDFQADYQRFVDKHAAVLDSATKALTVGLAVHNGTQGAVRAAERELDRTGVQIANHYGAGHPWLSCQQLRQVTQGLVLAQGSEALLAAADQLLSPNAPPNAPAQLALAGH